MVNTYNYNNLFHIYLHLLGDKTCRVNARQTCDWREVINKLAVIVWGNRGVGAEMDVSLFPARRCNEAKTVYISQKSKIPRDLVRRTYKITMSPKKADLVVIPALQNEYNITYNYLARDTVTQDLYIVSFIRAYVHTEESRCDSVEEANIKREALAKIMRGLPGTRFEDEIEWLYDDGGLDKKLFFVSNISEYSDLLNNTYPGRRYIFDSQLVLTGGAEISVETLDVWNRIPPDEMNLFEKAILSSDWKKYPYTMCAFINNKCPYYSTGGQFGWLLKTIDYFSYTRSEDNREIQPEDWNMLQKYILHKYDLGENGGYGPRSDEPCFYDLKSMLRHRTVFKPFYIDKPMKLKNILEALELSS